MFDRENPKMSPRESGVKCLDFRMENMLQHALLMTEIGMDLKERHVSGEKYVSYLKSMLYGAGKALSTLQVLSKSALLAAQKMLLSITATDLCLNPSISVEYERLLHVIEKQLSDFDDLNSNDQTDDNESDSANLSHVSEKIKYLETKQRNSEHNLLPTTASNKSVKADIDEKYPENWSRESLIDLNTVVNLPPVPEDIFTSFSSKPTRSSSLSSLKSMRKVKLFLQKAESFDDEDSSDNEDHYDSKLVYGDSDESKASGGHSPTSKKLLLGNIKEESQD